MKRIRTFTFEVTTGKGVTAHSEGLALKEVLHRLKMTLPTTPADWTITIKITETVQK